MSQQHEFFQATVKRHEDEIHLIQGDVTIRVSQSMAEAFTASINEVSKEIEREDVKKQMKDLGNDFKPRPLRLVDSDNPEGK